MSTFTVDESRFNLAVAKLRALSYLLAQAADSELEDGLEEHVGTVGLMVGEATAEISAAVQSSNSARKVA